MPVGNRSCPPTAIPGEPIQPIQTGGIGLGQFQALAGRQAQELSDLGAVDPLAGCALNENSVSCGAHQAVERIPTRCEPARLDSANCGLRDARLPGQCSLAHAGRPARVTKDPCRAHASMI